MWVQNAKTYISNVKRFTTVINFAHKFEEKFKGTIVEKWAKYWKTLYTDYKEVAIDLKRDFKQKPVKGVTVLSYLTFLGICAKTNPDEVTFRDALLKSTVDMVMVSPNLQRTDSIEHLQLLEKCYNATVIRRLSLIFFSVMWVDNDSCECDNYECTCSYLKLPYLQFFKRIIDIGFMNKWWLLENHMQNYDINF